ncbi:histidine phosphatase family protein [Diaphorobacter caeni]|uniref:histidine phosphatase family protein n=1 Tax=Diaphorobacter caeni TaxID=2784387 RepID=UPI00188F6F92|nr:histidine phosphatase family protein [Diaphorobacter caeni]MBF5007527.1 histidine phosphatase family protein [Diaphorobacter caeni]
MGTLYLVRHGQASFGAENYDQLSARGVEQCVRLGEYWRERGMQFDAVIRGSLQRHAQTLDAICQGMQMDCEPLVTPALNEYDSHALIAAVRPGPRPEVHTPELYKQHFRLLCDALAQWMSGTITPVGMPGWDEFSGGVRGVLEQVRDQHVGRNVLLVSSGGPIATAMSEVLSTPAEMMIALNMRIRNSAVTEFSISPRRLMLQTFNSLAHLDSDAHRDWITYA